jgi:hypothetical protein
MGGRLLFGHLPDRIGGANIALIFVLIEASGQASDLAGSYLRTGTVRSGCSWIRLLARLSKPWRGSVPTRTTGEPQSRHGSLRRISRFGAGSRQPRTWLGCEWSGSGCRLPSQHPGRALRCNHRSPAPTTDDRCKCDEELR